LQKNFLNTNIVNYQGKPIKDDKQLEASLRKQNLRILLDLIANCDKLKTPICPRVQNGKSPNRLANIGDLSKVNEDQRNKMPAQNSLVKVRFLKK